MHKANKGTDKDTTEIKNTQKQWIAPQVNELKTHHLSASGTVHRGWQWIVYWAPGPGAWVPKQLGKLCLSSSKKAKRGAREGRREDRGRRSSTSCRRKQIPLYWHPLGDTGSPKRTPKCRETTLDSQPDHLGGEGENPTQGGKAFGAKGHGGEQRRGTQTFLEKSRQPSRSASNHRMEEGTRGNDWTSEPQQILPGGGAELSKKGRGQQKSRRQAQIHTREGRYIPGALYQWGQVVSFSKESPSKRIQMHRWKPRRRRGGIAGALSLTLSCEFSIMGFVRCKGVSPAVAQGKWHWILLLMGSSILTKPLALAMIGLDISPRGFSS